MGINGALELHDDWMVNSWMFYASTDFYRLLPHYPARHRGSEAPGMPGGQSKPGAGVPGG